MDLKKAKIILIVFFLLINLTMLSIIVFSGKQNKVSKNIIEDVYDIFEQKNKEILCDIPNDLSPLPQLEMGENINSDIIQGTQVKSELIGFDTSQYEVLFKAEGYSVYAMKYNKKIILENRIIVDDSKMTYSYRDIIGFSKDEKSIIPAHTILIKEYLNDDSKIIEKIELVYIKYANENFFGPVWFILSDGEPRYFYALDAFNGVEHGYNLKQ